MQNVQLSVVSNALCFGLWVVSLSLKCSSPRVIFCVTALLFNYTAQRKVSTDKSSESSLLLVLGFFLLLFFFYISSASSNTSPNDRSPRVWKLLERYGYMQLMKYACLQYIKTCRTLRKAQQFQYLI